MATEMIAARLKIDEERIIEALQQAEEKLSSVDGEVILDFSSLRRIDAAALEALEGFAVAADAKGVKVVLRGVDIAVYKVLKLMKLKSRFSFTS
jgi:anti-anti-sigma regulatory factor